ncbi:MAG: hypothetical protein K2N27_11980 [Ruminococcus sp.]|nr:hypothetical protein [Ruminococcus sp.]
MDKNSATAWLIGVIVTLSIILIGKGCMGEPDVSGLKKNKKSKNDSSIDINIRTEPVHTQPPEYDIFGNPIITTATIPATEVTTETTIIETDVFGNPVTTAENFETDVFGNTVTTVFTVETDVFGNPVSTDIIETTTQTTDDTPMETTTLSPFEQYQESLNDPHSIGGFNHNKYDDEGNPIPTLPPGFAIVIE